MNSSRTWSPLHVSLQRGHCRPDSLFSSPPRPLLSPIFSWIMASQLPVLLEFHFSTRSTALICCWCFLTVPKPLPQLYGWGPPLLLSSLVISTFWNPRMSVLRNTLRLLMRGNCCFFLKVCFDCSRKKCPLLTWQPFVCCFLHTPVPLFIVDIGWEVM